MLIGRNKLLGGSLRKTVGFRANHKLQSTPRTQLPVCQQAALVALVVLASCLAQLAHVRVVRYAQDMSLTRITCGCSHHENARWCRRQPASVFTSVACHV